jgi:hypothetical protein
MKTYKDLVKEISESTQAEQMRAQKMNAAITKAYEALQKNTDKSKQKKLSYVWEKAKQAREDHEQKVMDRESRLG